MVRLLTDYTTQIYHALSTDTRPTANTGDQLREIDTGKRYIFDGTSWLELPDGGGGGGGGEPVYGLLTEINITEPVSELRYDIPSFALADGRVWGELNDITLSASDYLYVGVMNSTEHASASGCYFAQATSINSGHSLHMFQNPRTFNGHNYPGWSVSRAQEGGRIGQNINATLTPTAFKSRCYDSSTTITGGTIRIYGRIS